MRWRCLIEKRSNRTFSCARPFALAALMRNRSRRFRRTPGSNPSPTENEAGIKKPAWLLPVQVFVYGGERGIRTPGPFRVNGFQDRRFRPLSQLSSISQIVSATVRIRLRSATQASVAALLGASLRRSLRARLRSFKIVPDDFVDHSASSPVFLELYSATVRIRLRSATEGAIL